MKNTLLFCLLFAGGTTALAQPLQTLYYKNGAKYLEGHWTFTKRSLIPRLTGFEKRGDRQTQPPTPYGEAAERHDADAALEYPNRWDIIRDPTEFLHIMPADGTLKFWPGPGPNYFQYTYKNGMLQGPLAEFYSPGKVLQRGNILNGMPDGPWTYYYKNGSPFYTGAYKAYSQSQLEQIWAGDYSHINNVNDGSGRSGGTGYERALLLGYRVSSSLPFYNLLIGGTQKQGRFTFWKKGGSKWAEMEFDSDLPVGTWKVWEITREKPTLLLEWKAGEVVAITDSAGTRRDLRAIEAEIKAKDEALRQRDVVVRRPAGEPVGVEVGIVNPHTPNMPGSPPKAYNYVEQMPSFKGNIWLWIKENLRYPPAALKDAAQGRVLVKITIQPDGSVADASVEKPIRPDLDAEAIRLVLSMPNWEPGFQDGKAVSVYYRIPIHFKLPE